MRSRCLTHMTICILIYFEFSNYCEQPGNKWLKLLNDIFLNSEIGVRKYLTKFYMSWKVCCRTEIFKNEFKQQAIKLMIFFMGLPDSNWQDLWTQRHIRVFTELKIQLKFDVSCEGRSSGVWSNTTERYKW